MNPPLLMGFWQIDKLRNNETAKRNLDTRILLLFPQTNNNNFRVQKFQLIPANRVLPDYGRHEMKLHHPNRKIIKNKS